MRTLLIDNYDSFTFNLFHLLGEVNGDEPIVVRNDELTWDELAALPVDNIVISPGPGRPERARDVGVSLDVLRRAEVPVLGVCLGHQALAYAAGGAIEHAPEVMHGRLSAIHHDGRGLFAGIPQGFEAVRYHSLVVGAVPASCASRRGRPTAVVMGLEHRTRPLWGVQFHPESICTEHGRTLVRNFRDLTRAQAPSPARAPRRARRPAAGARCATARSRPGATPRPRSSRSTATAITLCGWTARAWSPGSRASRSWALPTARSARSSATTSPHGRSRSSARAVGRCGGRACSTTASASSSACAPMRPSCRSTSRAASPATSATSSRPSCGGELAHRSPLPDAALVFCDRLVAFDHDERGVHLLALADATGVAAADAWLAATERGSNGPPRPRPQPPAAGALYFAAREARDAYLANIAACKHEIFEGETYEICLTTELRGDGAIDPLAAYRALRARNPAPHAALLRLGDVSVLSSSPERFLRVDRERIVESKPMKGTAAARRPPRRGRLPRRRAARRRQVARREPHDRRPRAQRPRARLRAGQRRGPGVHGRRVLRHRPSAGHDGPRPPARRRVRDRRHPRGLSGGSMTGAPKLRTMEIIDRLEGGPRGVYSGALGFLSVNGTADLSIVIRTLVASRHGLQIGSGGAIVAASDPEAEHEEMLLKARAVLEAVGGTLATARARRRPRMDPLDQRRPIANERYPLCERHRAWIRCARPLREYDPPGSEGSGASLGCRCEKTCWDTRPRVLKSDARGAP